MVDRMNASALYIRLENVSNTLFRDFNVPKTVTLFISIVLVTTDRRTEKVERI